VLVNDKISTDYCVMKICKSETNESEIDKVIAVKQEIKEYSYQNATATLLFDLHARSDQATSLSEQELWAREQLGWSIPPEALTPTPATKKDSEEKTTKEEEKKLLLLPDPSKWIITSRDRIEKVKRAIEAKKKQTSSSDYDVRLLESDGGRSPPDDAKLQIRFDADHKSNEFFLSS
jgi:hypothetical protein